MRPSVIVPRPKQKKGVGMMEVKPGVPLARAQSPFFTPVQAADFVKLSWRTLERMRQNGEGPAYRKHGRYIRYHIADLEAWSNTHAMTRTDAPPRA
jgi:excisionase family DNA binding protein